MNTNNNGGSRQIGLELGEHNRDRKMKISLKVGEATWI